MTRLIDAEALKEATKGFIDCDGFNPVWQIIDNALTVEDPQIMVPVATVTFDNDKLKELTDDIVERIKSGELVLKREERPTGKWIRTGLYGQTVLECDQCTATDYDCHYHKFCPNCGAKMEVKKNE